MYLLEISPMDFLSSCRSSSFILSLLLALTYRFAMNSTSTSFESCCCFLGLAQILYCTHMRSILCAKLGPSREVRSLTSLRNLFSWVKTLWMSLRMMLRD